MNERERIFVDETDKRMCHGIAWLRRRNRQSDNNYGKHMPISLSLSFASPRRSVIQMSLSKSVLTALWTFAKKRDYCRKQNVEMIGYITVSRCYKNVAVYNDERKLRRSN